MRISTNLVGTHQAEWLHATTIAKLSAQQNEGKNRSEFSPARANPQPGRMADWVHGIEVQTKTTAIFFARFSFDFFTLAFWAALSVLALSLRAPPSPLRPFTLLRFIIHRN